MITLWLPILPIIIPLLAAVATFFTWDSKDRQRWVTLIAMGILVYVSLYLLMNVLKHGFLVSYVSNWAAPYGITLVADGLSAIMLCLTAITAFCVALYSIAELNTQQVNSGFYPAYCILIVGLSGAFLTGDLFNLYVWFEVTIIASFVLMACGGTKLQLDGTVKYVVLNLIGTLILLIAIVLLYGMTGTLNMADMANRLHEVHSTGLLTAVLVLLMIAFAMKAALFPLFFWLPASYHTPAYSSSAIFAGLLTKLGVYSIIRIGSLFFIFHAAYLRYLLLGAALLTLIIGMLGAIAQTNFRRILSFTLISHIGFMIIGFALFTPLAVAAGLFYLLQHVLVKANLFMAGGLAKRYTNESDITKMGGLYKKHPYFSLLFLLSALALAGFPPLSGFWAKMALIHAGLQSHAYLSVFLMLITSLLTLFVVCIVWFKAFLKPATDPGEKIADLSKREKYFMYAPMIILAALTLYISLYPEPIFHITQFAAQQLLHPQQYIKAVLPGVSS